MRRLACANLTEQSPNGKPEVAPLIQMSRFRVYWMHRGALATVPMGLVACKLPNYLLAGTLPRKPVKKNWDLCIFFSQQKDCVAMSHHTSYLPFICIILSDKAKRPS
jgi:hypothetical protein